MGILLVGSCPLIGSRQRLKCETMTNTLSINTDVLRVMGQYDDLKEDIQGEYLSDMLHNIKREYM